MNGFRDRIARFMYGRYGLDQLSKTMTYIILVILVITLFVRIPVLHYIALIGVVIVYYRALSRNIYRRTQENERYLKIHYACIKKFNMFRGRMKDSKTHAIFKCPNCSQKIRVPRGKGKISIKCPKCRIEFIKRT